MKAVLTIEAQVRNNQGHISLVFDRAESTIPTVSDAREVMDNWAKDCLMRRGQSGIVSNDTVRVFRDPENSNDIIETAGFSFIPAADIVGMKAVLQKVED